MAVLNPRHLLDQADDLLRTKNSLGQVRQSERRRAISAAYYAVFHLVLTAVADEFVGKDQRATPRYALVYRSLNHPSLEATCKVAARERIDGKHARYVPEGGFGPNIREFALLLIELKEKRNSADYDPSHWVKIIDARTAISAARSAIERFGTASAAQRTAFLTLAVFPPR